MALKDKIYDLLCSLLPGVKNTHVVTDTLQQIPRKSKILSWKIPTGKKGVVKCSDLFKNDEITHDMQIHSMAVLSGNGTDDCGIGENCNDTLLAEEKIVNNSWLRLNDASGSIRHMALPLRIMKRVTDTFRGEYPMHQICIYPAQSELLVNLKEELTEPRVIQILLNYTETSCIPYPGVAVAPSLIGMADLPKNCTTCQS